MRALIIGGDGLVGHALCKMIGHDAMATTRRYPEHSAFYFNLEKPGIIGSLFLSSACDVVFIVAAITKVVDCESDPQLTWRINADGPAHVVCAARRSGVFPVFISSDAVERAPNLNYSRQKAYVETIVLSGDGAVIRPSRIPPDSVNDLCKELRYVGQERQNGVIRWSP